MLNRMSLGTAWSSMELCELAYDEALRLLHTLSSDNVRYSERLGDKLPAANTCRRRMTICQDAGERLILGSDKRLLSALPFLGTAGSQEQARGWLRQGHHGAVSGINYSLCSQEDTAD